MFERVFISNQWIADGYFAVRPNEIRTNFDNLATYANEVENSEQFEAWLIGEKDTESYLCFIFEYVQTKPNWQYSIKKEVLINQFYINTITDCHPHEDEWIYKYSPSQQVILVYDEDDCLIGFVKEIVYDA